jgi:trehalose transport system permease protein
VTTTMAPRTTGKRQEAPRHKDRLDPFLKVAFPFWVVVSVLLVLFPVYLIFMVSFAPGSALFGERPPLVITEFTLQWWDRVISGGDLIEPLIKSLTVATLSTAIAILIAAPAAYVISRLPPLLAYTIVIALLVTRMFPEFTIGISVATWFARLNLIDTYLGLILAHLIGALPFIAWILVGTFETVPAELEEAAHIDGASRLTTLLRVVFPVAAPGIAVAALFVWLYSWNEFLYARLLTTNQNTLPLQVFQAIDRGTLQQMATVAAVLTLPILMVVYFLQRYLRPGALSGAVKG